MESAVETKRDETFEKESLDEKILRGNRFETVNQYLTLRREGKTDHIASLFTEDALVTRATASSQDPVPVPYRGRERIKVYFRERPFDPSIPALIDAPVLESNGTVSVLYTFFHTLGQISTRRWVFQFVNKGSQIETLTLH